MERLLSELGEWNGPGMEPIDLLQQEVLNVEVLDDGSSVSIPDAALEALRTSSDRSYLTVGLNEAYPDLLTRMELGQPYRMHSFAVDFSRGPNEFDPREFHKLENFYSFYSIDPSGSPSSGGPIVVSPELSDEDYTTSVDISTVDEYQISVGVKVGESYSGSGRAVFAKPVDAIFIAFEGASSYSALQVWGAIDAEGRRWRKIPLSELSCNGWKSGILQASGVANYRGEAALLLFDRTEYYPLFKVVFAQPYTLTCYGIEALSLFGEVSATKDSQAYFFPKPNSGVKSKFPGTAERSFFGRTVPTSSTRGTPASWPHEWGRVYDCRVDFSKTNRRAAIVLNAVGTTALAVATLTINDTTGDAVYNSFLDIDGASEFNGAPARRLAFYDERIYISAGAGSSVFRAYDAASTTIVAGSTPQSSSITNVDHAGSMAVEDDGGAVWMLAIEEDASAGAMRVRRFNSSTLAEDTGSTIDVFTGVNMPVGGHKDWPIFQSGGFLYLFQEYAAPYWQKYDIATQSLVASRAELIEDGNGNLLHLEKAWGISYNEGYVYCLFESEVTELSPYKFIVAKMTPDFGLVDWHPILEDKEYRGIEFDLGKEHVWLFGDDNDVDVGWLDRQREFKSSSLPSKVVFWPFGDIPVSKLRYRYDAWSFSGVGEGVDISSLFAFCDPGGISFSKSGLKVSDAGVQLPSASPGSYGKATPVLVEAENISGFSPISATVFVGANVFEETYTVGSGADGSFRLTDRYGRNASYLLNAPGAGLGSSSDSSLDVSSHSDFTTEFPWSASLSSSGDYKVNYETAEIEAYTDPLTSGTLAFLLPDIGATLLEFRGLLLAGFDKWAGFESVSVADFGALESGVAETYGPALSSGAGLFSADKPFARIEVRTNLTRIDFPILARKRLLVSVLFSNGTEFFRVLSHIVISTGFEILSANAAAAGFAGAGNSASTAAVKALKENRVSVCKAEAVRTTSHATFGHVQAVLKSDASTAKIAGRSGVSSVSLASSKAAQSNTDGNRAQIDHPYILPPYLKKR